MGWSFYDEVLLCVFGGQTCKCWRTQKLKVYLKTEVLWTIRLLSRSYSAFERTSFSWNIIPNKSLFLDKWKMGLHVTFKHGLIRSPSLISQLLWIYLILSEYIMLPVLWPWHSSHRFWVIVQGHPSQSVFGKQKIRPGHSVCCQSSDQGHIDLQSPRRALALVRNNSSYFTGHADSCCRLGKREETMYTAASARGESPYLVY